MLEVEENENEEILARSFRMTVIIKDFMSLILYLNSSLLRKEKLFFHLFFFLLL